MRFHILASSSKANCSLLETQSSLILIDAGLGVRKLEAKLKVLGKSFLDINAIFITHEHSDHISALKSIVRKYPHIYIFCNEYTKYEVQKRIKQSSLNLNINWQIFEDGQSFEFQDLSISSFNIPHDAVDAVGYEFSFECENFPENRCKLVFATDLGEINNAFLNKAKKADILIVESNYDEQMLFESDRHQILKDRISNSGGHLSNKDCFNFINNLQNDKLRNVFLAHLSRECNSLELVEKIFDKIENKNCKIRVVNPFDDFTENPFLIDF